jgi:hypothetical protein
MTPERQAQQTNNDGSDKAGLVAYATPGLCGFDELRFLGPSVAAVWLFGPGSCHQLRALCFQQFGASRYSKRGRLGPQIRSRVQPLG